MRDGRDGGESAAFWRRVSLWLTAVAFVFTPEAGDAAGRIAIVIGNSAYKDLAPLASAAGDARLVNEALKAAGFETEIVANAGSAKLSGALQDFSRRAAQADTALIYFQGYVSEAAKSGYLLPTDFSEASPARSGPPSVDSVVSALTGSRAAKVLIVDAVQSHANAVVAAADHGAARGLGSLDDSQGSSSGGEDAPDRGGIIVYSVADKPAAASDLAPAGGAQDPFAASFLRHLAEPGIAAVDLFRKVNADLAAGPQRRRLQIFDFLAQPCRLGR